MKSIHFLTTGAGGGKAKAGKTTAKRGGKATAKKAPVRKTAAKKVAPKASRKR